MGNRTACIITGGTPILPLAGQPEYSTSSLVLPITAYEVCEDAHHRARRVPIIVFPYS